MKDKSYLILKKTLAVSACVFALFSLLCPLVSFATGGTDPQDPPITPAQSSLSTSTPSTGPAVTSTPDTGSSSTADAQLTSSPETGSTGTSTVTTPALSVSGTTGGTPTSASTSSTAPASTLQTTVAPVTTLISTTLAPSRDPVISTIPGATEKPGGLSTGDAYTTTGSTSSALPGTGGTSQGTAVSRAESGKPSVGESTSATGAENKSDSNAVGSTDNSKTAAVIGTLCAFAALLSCAGLIAVKYLR